MTKRDDDTELHLTAQDSEAVHADHSELDEHSGLLFEHLELREYIRAFEGSADRVRWVAFIMIAFAAVISVTAWNGSDSWLRHRYETLRTLQNKIEKIKDPIAQQIEIQRSVGNISSPDELTHMVEKLGEQRVERLLMFDVRWLGVSIDFNDIVIFAGLTFILLFLLLFLSLIRYHENLYLALYKVRQLAKKERNRARGESKANFLYHALAMAQVLNFPPTLARWSAHRLQNVLHLLLLLVPTCIVTYIAWVNWHTSKLASQYDLTPRTPLQVGLCLTLLVFAIICFRYSTLANARWRGAFFHVNAAHRFIEPPPWRIWMRLAPKEHRRPRVELALLAELTEGAELRNFGAMESSADDIIVGPNKSLICTTHQLTRSGPKKTFNFTEQELFSESIETEAAETIAERIGTNKFNAFDHEIVENVLSPTHWTIRIKWTVEYDAS